MTAGIKKEKSEDLQRHGQSLVARIIKWWLKGDPWIKTTKILFLLLIIYNLFAFIFMWCPPVRGIVVDIDTGKPIIGAEVLKAAEGPFIGDWVVGGSYFGASETSLTDKDGYFHFPGCVGRLSLKEATPYTALWPIQWISQIDVAVWHPDFIGVDSQKEGLWWGEDLLKVRNGYCSVERLRIPILGYYYKIKMKVPGNEKEWQAKIGSVNLYFDQETKDKRLFNDFSGYLDRFPNGEKAWDYFIQLFSLTGGDYERRDIKDAYSKGKYTKAEVEEIYRRNKKLLELADKIKEPNRTVQGTIELQEITMSPLQQKSLNWEKEQRKISMEQRKRLVMELEQVLGK